MIELLENELRESQYIDVSLLSLRLKTPLDKPLVVLLSWLMSKEKHLKKYAQLYIDQGFDVLTVSVTPWQVIWPKKGTQVICYFFFTFHISFAIC